MKPNDEKSIDRLELLMETKSFIQLSSEEREWVLNFVDSEEEYETIRSVDAMLMSIGSESPELNPATIHKLKTHLKGNSPTLLSRLFQQKVPAWGMAVVALIFMVAWVMIPTAEPSKQIVERFTVKSDTVFITRKDTVFINRVVFRERPANPFIQTKSKQSIPTPEGTNGSSMKEQEELQSLLVSGTDQR
jgi:hypothetical protein